MSTLGDRVDRPCLWQVRLREAGGWEPHTSPGSCWVDKAECIFLGGSRRWLRSWRATGPEGQRVSPATGLQWSRPPRCRALAGLWEAATQVLLSPLALGTAGWPPSCIPGPGPGHRLSLVVWTMPACAMGANTKWPWGPPCSSFPHSVLPRPSLSRECLSAVI